MADVTLSELQSLRAALIRIRMSGVLTMMHGGRQLTYKSDKDLARAIADCDERIAILDGSALPRTTGGAVDMML